MTNLAFIAVFCASTALLAGVLLVSRNRRLKFREQARLSLAFERARMMAETGSGVQGSPYVSGESAWSNETQR
jgi:hypothetical protein